MEGSVLEVVEESSSHYDFPPWTVDPIPWALGQDLFIGGKKDLSLKSKSKFDFSV